MKKIKSFINKPITNNFKKDIKIGRSLLLIQAICLVSYGVLEAIRLHIIGGIIYHILIIFNVIIIFLSWLYMKGYLHRKKIPIISPLFSVALLLMTIDSFFSTYITIKTGLSISKTIYYNDMYIIFDIFILWLLIFSLIFYKNLIPHFEKKLPTFYKYLRIQNIRIKKKKLNRKN